MKKKSLKTLSIILALILVVSTVGCGVKNDPDPVPDTGPPAASVDTPASATPDKPVNTQPAPTEPEPAPEDAVLVIYGEGVEAQTNWTLEELQDLEEGYREITYSTTNNWPTLSKTIAHGVSIPYLLEQAGVLDSAKTFVFSAPDGYRANITREQLYGARYAYAEHSAAGSSGAEQVDAIIAWEWGDKEAVPEDIRPYFGQSGPMDVNTASSVKGLYRIEVLAWDAGTWDMPEPSIASGSAVPKGTELDFTHPNMDNIRLYYTLDGSDPDYNSEVYNKSTSYFQPDLIVPIVIDSDITIKVLVSGLGKADGEIITLSYTVS